MSSVQLLLATTLFLTTALACTPSPLFTAFCTPTLGSTGSSTSSLSYYSSEATELSLLSVLPSAFMRAMIYVVFIR